MVYGSGIRYCCAHRPCRTLIFNKCAMNEKGSQAGFQARLSAPQIQPGISQHPQLPVQNVRTAVANVCPRVHRALKTRVRHEAAVPAAAAAAAMVSRFHGVAELLGRGIRPVRWYPRAGAVLGLWLPSLVATPSGWPVVRPGGAGQLPGRAQTLSCPAPGHGPCGEGRESSLLRGGSGGGSWRPETQSAVVSLSLRLSSL